MPRYNDLAWRRQLNRASLYIVGSGKKTQREITHLQVTPTEQHKKEDTYFKEIDSYLLLDKNIINVWALYIWFGHAREGVRRLKEQRQCFVA